MGSRVKEALRDVSERNKLVVNNLGLVGSTVKQLMRIRQVTQMGYEDAFQAGVIGLMRAADLWDETLHNKFSTYATPAIRNRILNDCGVYGGVIRVPNWVRTSSKPEEKVPEDIRKARDRANRCTALPQHPSEFGSVLDDDHAPTEQALTYEDSSPVIDEDEFRVIIKQARKLPRHQAVAFRRVIVEGRSVAQVSQAAGVTKQAIRHALGKARAQLRAWLISRGYDKFGCYVG